MAAKASRLQPYQRCQLIKDCELKVCDAVAAEVSVVYKAAGRKRRENGELSVNAAKRVARKTTAIVSKQRLDLS